ncbi:MAG: 50S ribosomal protein L40e [Thermoproteota archaeon]|jgi:large subunit ribosomal protein L40e|nr:50S ribosomal protein L40e [Thermoproteota archaeon]
MPLPSPEKIQLAQKYLLFVKICRECGARNSIKAEKCRKCRRKNLRLKRREVIKK